MDVLSIAQLAQFSGIKAHTIRIWEQRYHALDPDRSEGNVREYNGMHLRRLLNIVSLTEGGHKISSVGKMQNTEMDALIVDLFKLDDFKEVNVYIPQLIAAGMQYDEFRFNEILDGLILKLGIVEAYKNVIYPLINQVGLMWSANLLPPAHEHFISNLIRQKILCQTELLPIPSPGAEKWVLLLPENEFHEIGLLVAQYMLKLKGISVVYLGANVPIGTLNIALRELQADNVFLFFVHNDYAENIQYFLNAMDVCYVKSKVFISGHTKICEELTLCPPFVWLKSVGALEDVLSSKNKQCQIH